MVVLLHPMVPGVFRRQVTHLSGYKKVCKYIFHWNGESHEKKKVGSLNFYINFSGFELWRILYESTTISNVCSSYSR